MHRWSHRRPRRVARRHLPGAPLRRPHGGTAVARGLTRLLRRRHAGSVVTSPTVEAAIGWRRTTKAAAPWSARTSGTSCPTRTPPTEAPWNTGSHSRRIPNLTEGPYKTTASSSSNRAASGSRFSPGYARSAPGSSGSNSSSKRQDRAPRRCRLESLLQALGFLAARTPSPSSGLGLYRRCKLVMTAARVTGGRGGGRHGRRPAVCQPRKSSSARLNCSGWVALRPCGPPSISGSELPSIAS